MFDYQQRPITKKYDEGYERIWSSKCTCTSNFQSGLCSWCAKQWAEVGRNINKVNDE